MDQSDRDFIDHAFSYYAHQIADVHAEALACRIVSTLLIDWLVQKEPRPAELLQEMAEAVDRAFTNATFVDYDGGANAQFPALGERIRELGRELAQGMLQNAFRRHAG